MISEDELEALLAELPESLQAMDLVGEINRSIDAAEPRRRRFGFPIASGLLAAAAAATLWWATAERREDTTTGGFHAKANNPAQLDKWVATQVYAIGNGVGENDVAAARVHETIRRDDDLAFSYTNVNGEGFSYLLVGGVTQEGAVYWFLSDPTLNVSIPIESGVSNKEVPMRVHHDLPLGPLRIVSIFTHTPMRTEDAEQALRQGARVLDSGAHSLEVVVVP